MYRRISLTKTLQNLEKGVFQANQKRGGEMEEQWIKECVLYTHRQVSKQYKEMKRIVHILLRKKKK